MVLPSMAFWWTRLSEDEQRQYAELVAEHLELRRRATDRQVRYDAIRKRGHIRYRREVEQRYPNGLQDHRC